MAADGPNPARKLALLDVDGTLTDTVAVDLRCFLATLADLFGFGARADDYDWGAVRHATDPGLLEAAFEQFAGRRPRAEEEAAFVGRFVAALEGAAQRAPAEFRPIGGAHELLAALAAAPGWSYGIATGCYAESARLKLALAGLTRAGEPLATASEAVSRDEIFRLAWRRVTEPAEPAAAVLVGDGTWDAATARNLGLPFVGIGRGRRAAELERLGAVAVLADFRPLSHTLEVLSYAAATNESSGAAQ